jgi:hypothetical protein
MANVNAYRRDLDAEVEGVWRDLQYGVRMKLGRLGNAEYRKELERIKREYRKDYPTDDSMPEDLRLEIVRRAFAKVIVRDWNVTDGPEGEEQPVPCVFDRVYAVLSDPELSDLYDDAFAKSLDGDVYRKRLELLAGNSGGDSAGSTKRGRSKKS